MVTMSLHRRLLLAGSSAIFSEGPFKNSDLPTDPWCFLISGIEQFTRLLTHGEPHQATNLVSLAMSIQDKIFVLVCLKSGDHTVLEMRHSISSHPDLSPNLDPLWNQNAWLDKPKEVSNHATMVAGVIARARNGEGSVGVAYNAKISGHSGYREDLFCRHYDVVNNSTTKPYNARFGKSFVGQRTEKMRCGDNFEVLYIETRNTVVTALEQWFCASIWKRSRAEGENANRQRGEYTLQASRSGY